MTMKYVFGIDIGTQGTKAVLFDRHGRSIAAAFRKSRLHQTAQGVVEEDPEFQLNTVCQCIRSCVTESGIDTQKVAALGIDGQMAGILGIAADGRHITPYDSWLDTRCSPYIGVMQQQAGNKIIRRTGGPASFNHGPKILWWKEEHPEVYARIVAFVQPASYVAMRLCELDADQAFIDKSYLHFSGFANNPKGQWDRKLCAEFDVDPSKLPRIVNSHEVVGALAPKTARRCQLQAGVPVIAGCGDTAASFLACGATRDGICVDVAGTASVFAATTRQFKADTRCRMLGWGQSATPGLWHPYAYINGGGMNLEWLAQVLVQVGRSRTEKTLDHLNQLAAQIDPQLADPMFVPHLGGRMSPSQPDLRGSWAGLSWSHSAAHLYRAVLESVALEYCLYRDVLELVNPELNVREVRITGGGEKSQLWNQIKADALGFPVVQLNRHEGAPLGVALLAGFGVGLCRSLPDAARKWIQVGQKTRVNRKLASHYGQRLAAYRQLLERLSDWTGGAATP
jgi:xylulokinase